MNFEKIFTPQFLTGHRSISCSLIFMNPDQYLLKNDVHKVRLTQSGRRDTKRDPDQPTLAPDSPYRYANSPLISKQNGGLPATAIVVVLVGLVWAVQTLTPNAG